MDYQNFEAHIDYHIIQRGQQYFALDTINQLKQEVNGWSAQVTGSTIYTVAITGSETIEAWSCTCPYDQGPVCKHVVAVLYAILNRRFEEMRNK